MLQFEMEKYMKIMKIKRILPVILSCCLLTGCEDLLGQIGHKTQQPGIKNEYRTILSNAGHVEYEVPEGVPKILINQAGYKPDGDKVAIFRGEALPSSFKVVDAKTGAAIYTGAIGEGRYNETLEEYNSYGVFSEVTEPGRYYIKADRIGMSYPFEIKEDVYGAVYYETFRSYADRTNEADTVILCEEMTVLLLSFELYADAYMDSMNIPESGNGIPDLVDVMHRKAAELFRRQNAETGGIRAAAGTMEEDAQASLYGAAAMAKFSIAYKQYDAAYAEECLLFAKKALEYVRAALPKQDGGLVYFAATELYRATGAPQYALLLKEYCRVEERAAGTLAGSRVYFYGDTAYLSTTYQVDTALCEMIMNILRGRVEQIVGYSKREEYFTYGNKEQSNNEELLADMMELSVVNYIIANHEYGTVLQNHLHYFLGRNAKCITYLPGIGYTYCESEESLLASELRSARFLALLSAISQEKTVIASSQGEG